MKKRIILGGLLGLVVFSFKFASALTLREEGKKVLVENSFYKVTILPEIGGKISSLILKSSGHNLTMDVCIRGQGIGKDIELSRGFPGIDEMGYRYQLIEQTSKRMVVQLSSPTLTSQDIILQKQYIFSENSPVIKVKVRIENNGLPKKFGYRVHNSVVAGKKVDKNDIFFVPTTAGMKEIVHKPGEHYIKDSTQGWAGVIDKEAKEGLIFKVDHNALQQFYFWMAENASNIEWFYKDVSLETGSSWETIYYIIPVSNLSSIPVENDELVSKLKTKSSLSVSTSDFGIYQKDKGFILKTANQQFRVGTGMKDRHWLDIKEVAVRSNQVNTIGTNFITPGIYWTDIAPKYIEKARIVKNENDEKILYLKIKGNCHGKKIEPYYIEMNLKIKKGFPCLFICQRVINATDESRKLTFGNFASDIFVYGGHNVNLKSVVPENKKCRTILKGDWIWLKRKITEHTKGWKGFGIISFIPTSFWTIKGHVMFWGYNTTKVVEGGDNLEYKMAVMAAESPEEVKFVYEKIKDMKLGPFCSPEK